MSNYTKTTDFSAKDDLPSGDPDKVVVGAEIDDEFDAIQTAIATKANSSEVPALASSNTFTGATQIVSATLPVWGWHETDGATNEKYWKAFSDGGDFKIAVQDDAQGNTTVALLMTRTGYNIDTIVFQTNGVSEQMKLRSGGRIDFTNATVDAALTYSVTPTLQFGTTSNHNVDLIANNATRMTIRGDGPFKTQVFTVATLPAAGTVGTGARSFVTDANATTFASIVAGGGSNQVPVYCDGTNWRIG